MNMSRKDRKELDDAGLGRPQRRLVVVFFISNRRSLDGKWPDWPLKKVK